MLKIKLNAGLVEYYIVDRFSKGDYMVNRKSVSNTQRSEKYEKQIDERIEAALTARSEEELKKAIEIDSSNKLYKGKRRSRKRPKFWDINPLNLITVFEAKERDATLSFELLRRMSERNAIVSAIINTRINQVSRFSYPARLRDDRIGFKVRPLDPKQEIDEKTKKEITEIENFILNCGVEDGSVRDGFGEFLKKIVRDRLVYDAVCIELVRNRNGELVAFYAVDASTIRIVLPHKEGDGRYTDPTPDDVGYIQIVNGEKVAEFTYDELAYAVFYPRSHINSYGYGYSELEMLIKEITAHLNASEYNSRYFSQGALPKGVLNFKGGNLTKERLDDFRRQWQAQVAGLVGAWKMPIISAPDVQFIELQKSNHDMEFGKWMDYLVNVICAVYCIDPAEINFPSRGGSGSDSHESALFDNSYENKLRQSRDKGLYPLLDFIASTITRHIVWKINPNYVFVFEGLDRRMGMEKLKAQEIELRTYKTINEVRREEDLPEVPNGDIILAPEYINYQLKLREMEYEWKREQLRVLEELIKENLKLRRSNKDV